MAEQPPGQRIVAGRYQLRGELGRGGMGVVWQAWDSVLQRDVAVKEVLVPQDLTAEKRQEVHFRVLREARSAARISHPSVITIHDVFDFDDHPWVVMEWISGSSLESWLATSQRLPPELRAHDSHGRAGRPASPSSSHAARTRTRDPAAAEVAAQRSSDRQRWWRGRQPQLMACR